MKPFNPTETMLAHYIQNKLSEEDEGKVEVWLMEHPEAVDDLKLDLAFALGVKPLPEPAHSPKAGFGLFDWLFQPQVVMASLTTMVLGVFLGFIVGGSSTQGPYAPITNIERLSLEVTRSINNERPDARIYLDDEPAIVILEINAQPWFEQYQSFSLSLIMNETSTELGVQSPEDAILKLALESTRIEAENVLISLYGVSNNGEKNPLKDYRIEIIN